MNALTPTSPQSVAISAPVHSLGEIWKMAQAFSASGLFGINTPEAAMSLMLIAQAEGLHPAIAARDYHIIEGRPSLKADAMMARFQLSGGQVKWEKYTDEEVVGVFTHPNSPVPVRVDWSVAKAQKITRWSKKLNRAAPLTETSDNWKNYPRAMLRARVISEGVRTVAPGCVVGVYTPEEIQDFDDPRNVTPTEHKDVIPDQKPADIIRETRTTSAQKTLSERADEFVARMKTAASPEALTKVFALGSQLCAQLDTQNPERLAEIEALHTELWNNFEAAGDAE